MYLFHNVHLFILKLINLQIFFYTLSIYYFLYNYILNSIIFINIIMYAYNNLKLYIICIIGILHCKHEFYLMV